MKPVSSYSMTPFGYSSQGRQHAWILVLRLRLRLRTFLHQGYRAVTLGMSPLARCAAAWMSPVAQFQPPLRRQMHKPASSRDDGAVVPQHRHIIFESATLSSAASPCTSLTMTLLPLPDFTSPPSSVLAFPWYYKVSEPTRTPLIAQGGSAAGASECLAFETDDPRVSQSSVATVVACILPTFVGSKKLMSDRSRSQKDTLRGRYFIRAIRCVYCC
ncbi:hypothetical protein B0H67DRAFT_296364 [Lasiosphaeris hirsuta]|uniref:Uncharacterized protein n=1 Tax=Lasiosphaeris hirsuta TaxID=260670 RepID=A0AA40A967_9PEZI|nr:hypothetical protein B0H67DRAFT_296364 [Lasiosphaeris hirsuta]